MKINGWKTARKSKWVQRRSRSVFPIRVSRKTYCQEQTPMRLRKFKKNIQKYLNFQTKGAVTKQNNFVTAFFQFRCVLVCKG